MSIESEVPVLFVSRVVQTLRASLQERGFVELMTPLLRRHPGSALTPRLQLTDGDFLRDSPAYALRYNLQFASEIFEIGRCFRQGDHGSTHLREFTMLDLYWGGASLSQAATLASDLVSQFYRGEFKVLSVAEVIRQQWSIDLFNDPDAERELDTRLRGIYRVPGASYLELLDMYIRAEIQPLSEGCCNAVWDFPLEAEARAKRKDGTKCVADRMEFQINGMEVIQAYTDEVDLGAILARGVRQGDFELEDELMVEVLTGGLVPAQSSGFGIGIERLCMVCSGSVDIADFVASQPFTRL